MNALTPAECAALKGLIEKLIRQGYSLDAAKAYA